MSHLTLYTHLELIALQLGGKGTSLYVPRWLIIINAYSSAASQKGCVEAWHCLLVGTQFFTGWHVKCMFRFIPLRIHLLIFVTWYSPCVGTRISSWEWDPTWHVSNTTVHRKGICKSMRFSQGCWIEVMRCIARSWETDGRRSLRSLRKSCEWREWGVRLASWMCWCRR